MQTPNPCKSQARYQLTLGSSGQWLTCRAHMGSLVDTLLVGQNAPLTITSAEKPFVVAPVTRGGEPR